MARSCKSDPLEKFRFRVIFGNSTSEQRTAIAAGFHDVQAPKRATNKILYREGQDGDISSVSAGLSTFEDIVLSRGLMIAENTDQLSELYTWMSSVHAPSYPNFNRRNEAAANSEASGALDYRKEVTIYLLDRTGQVARGWKLHNAFPVNFVPSSDLSAADDGEKSLESITLAYEDFNELDKSAFPTTP